MVMASLILHGKHSLILNFGLNIILAIDTLINMDLFFLDELSRASDL